MHEQDYVLPSSRDEHRGERRPAPTQPTLISEGASPLWSEPNDPNLSVKWILDQNPVFMARRAPPVRRRDCCGKVDSVLILNIASGGPDCRRVDGLARVDLARLQPRKRCKKDGSVCECCRLLPAVGWRIQSRESRTTVHTNQA